MLVRVLTTVLLTAAGTLGAADAAYIGKWKLNPARSNFGESTITYTQLPGGEMQWSGDGQSYKFKMDGKDYNDPYGDTVSWKQIDANTWEAHDKLNGKALSTETFKVSGSTLTVVSTGTRPSGSKFETTTVYTRVSGTSGLAGKWKTKKMDSASPMTMEFAANGADGLELRLPDLNAVCKARFDGKDYPATGPTMPPDFTLALRKVAGGFEMIEKMKGKELYKDTFTVSADGKTMTDVSYPTGVNEKSVAVYDRQ